MTYKWELASSEGWHLINKNFSLYPFMKGLNVCQSIIYIFIEIWSLLFNFFFISCLNGTFVDEQIFLEGMSELKKKILLLLILYTK